MGAIVMILIGSPLGLAAVVPAAAAVVPLDPVEPVDDVSLLPQPVVTAAAAHNPARVSNTLGVPRRICISLLL
jgi:hypothetical protein